jgi:aspartate/methionine/tyrosine aminotransferase
MELSMFIEPFQVEIWMNEWETRCTHNLAETCVASITVETLLEISGYDSSALAELLPMKLTYGDIEGSVRLRSAIAALYDELPIERITITHGTIAANMLVHKTMLGRGDQVVSVVPTYQQHYSIPASLGAEVRLLKLQEHDGFLPDLERLKTLVTRETKLIALTNPNNPTGALIERPMLEEIVDIADSVGAAVLCDEVYRGTAQTGDGSSASIIDLYPRGISTASTSKAFSLAGLRVGWIAAPADITEQIAIHRDYDTISVGMINDHFASIALENADKLLTRSQTITRENLATLEAWIEGEPSISWVKPRAGTTAMIKLDVPMTSREFCIDLLQATGVMLTPGDAFDMEGYARLSFANEPSVLAAGLNLLSDYLRTRF